MFIRNNFMSANVGKSITICGGHSVSIDGDVFIVDGKKMTIDEMVANGIATYDGKSKDDKTLEITINGDVKSINGDASKFIVNGDCGSITTNMGDIDVKGNVGGNANTNMGNIMCGNVGGNATTNMGNVSYRK